MHRKRAAPVFFVAAIVLLSIFSVSMVSLPVGSQADSPDAYGKLDAGAIDLTAATRLTPVETNQTSPQAAGRYLVWEDDRNREVDEQWFDRDIYLMDLEPSTDRGGDPEAIPIASGPSDQYGPRIVETNSGAFVGYIDYNHREDFAFDLWGCEVTGSGNDRDGKAFMIHNGSSPGGGVYDFLLSPDAAFYSTYQREKDEYILWRFTYESREKTQVTNFSVPPGSYLWFQESTAIVAIHPATGQKNTLFVSEGYSSPRMAAWGDRLVLSNESGIYLYEKDDLYGKRVALRLLHEGTHGRDEIVAVPSINGDLITWHESFGEGGGKDWSNTELLLFDLSTNRLHRLTNDTGEQQFPVLTENRLFWQTRDFGGDWRILVYELPFIHGKEIFMKIVRPGERDRLTGNITVLVQADPAVHHLKFHVERIVTAKELEIWKNITGTEERDDGEEGKRREGPGTRQAGEKLPGEGENDSRTAILMREFKFHWNTRKNKNGEYDILVIGLDKYEREITSRDILVFVVNPAPYAANGIFSGIAGGAIGAGAAGLAPSAAGASGGAAGSAAGGAAATTGGGTGGAASAAREGMQVRGVRSATRKARKVSRNPFFGALSLIVTLAGLVLAYSYAQVAEAPDIADPGGFLENMRTAAGNLPQSAGSVLPELMEVALYVSVAVIFIVLTRLLIDMLSSRSMGIKTAFRIQLSGLVSLGLTSSLLGIPFGYPGQSLHVESEPMSGEERTRREAKIAMARILAVMGLLLPFGLLMRRSYLMADVGITTALMTCLSLSIPVKKSEGRMIFDWKKTVSVGMLIASGLLFYGWLFGIVGQGVVMVVGVLSILLLPAAISSRRSTGPVGESISFRSPEKQSAAPAGDGWNGRSSERSENYAPAGNMPGPVLHEDSVQQPSGMEPVVQSGELPVFKPVEGKEGGGEEDEEEDEEDR